MGVFSKTLYQLRQSLAITFDDNIMGRVESGNTTTFVCSYLLRGDDYYNGWDCHFYVGTHKDTSREVYDWVNSTKTITISPEVTASCDTTDYFELHKKFTTAQYNDVINRAIEIAKPHYLLDKILETTELAEDTYEYNVPSGFYYIKDIYLEDDTDAGIFYDVDKIDGRAWYIVPGTTPKIHFNKTYFDIGTDRDGLKLRIVGQQLESTLTLDADTCEVPPEYIIQQARVLLLAQDERNKAAMDIAAALAEKELRRMKVIPRGKGVYEL